MPLTPGSAAPDFKLLDQDGKEHKLSDYKGSWVLLYFYPKDDTPGCTKEACTIAEGLPKFKKMQAVVLGVSKDSVESHKKFTEKYGLPFTLLADTELEVSKKYDVWGERSFLGKKFMGVRRESFLINPEGKIVKVYTAVKPAAHADEVLADLAELAK